MGRQKELTKLIEEQKRDKGFFVYPYLTQRPKTNFLLLASVGELIRLLEGAELSDRESLCFVSKYILGWPKLHLSKIIKGMGQSHTAINNTVKSAEGKMKTYLGEYKKTKPKQNRRNMQIERELSESEEIKEIFDEFSGKQNYDE